MTEIKLGFYSDPPEESMYTYKLNNSQDIMKDQHGVAILNCKRDTNALEGQHSHINNTFGKRIVGWEFADSILAERRHRCNIDACKKNILAYPRIHHYDTWKIDTYQIRIEKKYNSLVYPSWVNASDISLHTDETFGFVPLAFDHLQGHLEKTQPSKLSGELQFLSKCWKCPIPPQP